MQNNLPNKDNLVKIGQASKILGVSIDTLRRWEDQGKIQTIKTPGGTRLYSVDYLLGFNKVYINHQGKDGDPFHYFPGVFTTIVTLIIFLTFLLTGSITGFYFLLPDKTKTFFESGYSFKAESQVLGSNTEPTNIFQTISKAFLSPFDYLSRTIITTTSPEYAKVQNIQVPSLDQLENQVENQDSQIIQLTKTVEELAVILNASEGSNPSDSSQAEPDQNDISGSSNIFDAITAQTAFLGETIIDSFGNIYPQAGTNISTTQLGTNSRPFYGMNLNRFTIDNGGNLKVYGQTILGDTSADYVSITGQLTNDLIPKNNNQISLGNGSAYYLNGFISTLTSGTGNFNQVNSSNITSSGLNTAGAVLYTQSGGVFAVTAQGSTNNCLLSAGSGTPTWGSCATGGAVWSDLTNPTANLSLSNSTYTTTFTTGATTQTFWTMTGTSFTTGELLDLTGTWAPTDGSDNEAIDINLTFTPTTSAATFRGLDLNVTEGANALANTLYGLKLTTNNSANTSTGTHTIYGGHFTTAGKTAGTTTAVGLYATASGADSNYAGIFEAGDVGIGITAPTALLHMSKSFATTSDGPTLRIENATNINALYKLGVIDFSSTDASSNLAGVVGRIELIADQEFSSASTPAGANTNMIFRTNTGNAGTLGEVMRLTYEGNVGIGDTSPSSRLEVGDGTDSLQISSVGDMTFVDADGGASITGPAGGALSILAGTSQALTLTAANSSTWSTSNGTLTLSGDDGLTLTTVAAGTDLSFTPADDLLFSPGDDTTWTLAAGGRVVIDAATTSNTTAGSGTIDFNITSTTLGNIGFNIDYIMADGTASGANLHGAQINIKSEDEDGDLFGLIINNAATATTMSADDVECLLCLDNDEDTTGVVTDAIRITSTGITAGITNDIKLQNSETISNSTDDVIAMTTGTGNGLVNILTGSLKVGDGSPTITLDGEDAYIEGSLEVDGAVNLAVVADTADRESLCIVIGGGNVTRDVADNNCDTSSLRFKHDIKYLNLSGIDLVNSFKPASFVRNSDTSSSPTVHWGFIAEDLASSDPHLGIYDKQGSIYSISKYGIWQF